MGAARKRHREGLPDTGARSRRSRSPSGQAVLSVCAVPGEFSSTHPAQSPPPSPPGASGGLLDVPSGGPCASSKNLAEAGGSGGQRPSGLLEAGISAANGAAQRGLGPPSRRVQKQEKRDLGTGIALPRWIQMCERGEAHLELVRRDGSEAAYAAAQCHSWRHAGDCRRWRTQQDFSRVRQALEDVPVSTLSMGVLTLDQADWKGRGLHPSDAYRLLVRLWKLADERLRRTMGGPWPYVASVEAHAPQRGGWPHLNVLTTNPFVAEFVRANPKGALRWWKEDVAIRAGFGWRTSLEPVFDAAGAACYITKHENAPHGGAVGEVVKLSQLPLNAPSKFRRLRSSKGFLPPAHTSSGEWTGRYVGTALPEVQMARQARGMERLAQHLGYDPITGELK